MFSIFTSLSFVVVEGVAAVHVVEIVVVVFDFILCVRPSPPPISLTFPPTCQTVQVVPMRQQQHQQEQQLQQLQLCKFHATSPPALQRHKFEYDQLLVLKCNLMRI